MKVFTLFVFVLLAELAFSSEFNNAQKQYLGAENILKNPGFENGKTAWTLTSGTLATESTIKLAGSKSLKATLSSQALELYQDSSLYASQFNGSVQGLGYIRIKTQVTGLKVCARKAGVIQTSLCIDVQANNEWGLYKIPFILGGTSNGLVVTSNGVSVTGDVYLDDAFVGAVDLSSTQSFDTTCDTIACETSFTAQVSASGVVGSENQNFIAGNCTMASGNSTCTFTSGTFSVTPNCTFQSINSVNTATILITAQSSASVSTLTRDSSSGAALNRAYVIQCERQGSDYVAALQARKDFEKSKLTSFSSTNADTDWQSCQFSTLAWQGLGTVTASNLRCKRQGSDLLVSGNWTSGATTTDEARIPLPIWNGSQLSIKAGESLSVAGRMSRSLSTAPAVKDYTVLKTGGQNYLGISFNSYDVATNPLVYAAGNAIVASGQTLSFENVRIPIQGWENSNIIIGQFNGLESCTDSYECTDTFSAVVQGDGTVVNENLDWIQGNCSYSSGLYTCDFKPGVFSVAPNVVPAANAVVANFGCTPGLSTATQVTVFCSVGTTPSNPGFFLIAQKQGADYIGKTAKAVASDQNVRSIGAVGVDIQSVYFGGGADCNSACTTGTCTVCKQVGSKITSVAWSASGSYRLNGIDGTKYLCGGQGFTDTFNSFVSVLTDNTPTYSLVTIRNTLNLNTNSSRSTVTCIGIP